MPFSNLTSNKKPKIYNNKKIQNNIRQIRSFRFIQVVDGDLGPVELDPDEIGPYEIGPLKFFLSGPISPSKCIFLPFIFKFQKEL